jgi:hypothetical protein
LGVIHLVCPQCRHDDAYEQGSIDFSKELICSACGFSGAPTSFELAKDRENKAWEAGKLVIILVVGIGFAFFGLSIIVSSVFYIPIIIAVVLPILWYRRWRKKNADNNQHRTTKEEQP